MDRSYEELLEAFKEALSRLQRLSIGIGSNSRLRQFERRLELNVFGPEIGIHRYKQSKAIELTTLTRDAIEIAFIVGHLPSTPDDALRERLRLLDEGHFLPDTEGASKAREAQFELWLWALSNASGWHATLGNPDLRISGPRGLLNVEIKRPSNAKRIDDVLRKAADQLRECKGAKAIAVSLDQVLRPPRQWVQVSHPWELNKAADELLYGYIDSYGHLSYRRCEGRGIAGIAFVAKLPSWVTTRATPTIFTAGVLQGLMDEASHDYQTLMDWDRAVMKQAFAK